MEEIEIYINRPILKAIIEDRSFIHTSKEGTQVELKIGVLPEKDILSKVINFTQEIEIKANEKNPDENWVKQIYENANNSSEDLLRYAIIRHWSNLRS